MAKLIRIVLGVTLFLNFAFPKAGTKISSIPVYVSLIPVLFLFLPYLLWKAMKDWKMPDQRKAFLMTFSIILIAAVNFIVMRPSLTLNAFMVQILPFFLSLLAVFFLFLFDYIPLKSETFLNIIIAAAIIIIVYALIQKIFGAMQVIIPGLTFNYAESSRLSSMSANSSWGKHNYLGSIHYLKIPSTYQNGNVFGVNLILLFWFAFAALWSKKSLLPKLSAILLFAGYTAACLFTASGTIYIGYAASLFMLFSYMVYSIAQSDRKNKRVEVALLIALPVSLILLAILLTRIFPELNMLLTKRLMNRDLLGNERFQNFMPYLTYLWDRKLVFQFLFGAMFDPARLGGAYEITLTAVFMNFGILFTLFFCYIIFQFLSKLKFTPYSIGIWAYVVMSFIDGAFWLPPTPFTFFILLGFLLKESKASLQK